MGKLLTENDPAVAEDALFYEYTSAVNPLMSPEPAVTYPAKLHREGATRIIPFDLSQQLHCASPATGPTVAASYLRICAGEELKTQVNASSQMYYVIRGQGSTESEFGVLTWGEGDTFVMPATEKPVLHKADTDTAIYFINDSPLIDYLGARAVIPQFSPTKYTHKKIMEELAKVDLQPGARSRNRDAIILGNKKITQVKSATHTLWSTFVQVHPGEVQRPHRHNSIAVDIVIKAAKGAYTLLGKEVNGDGNIINPQRIDWESHAAFVTPAGLWHGHYNESGETCLVMAAQEAGFYEYMRTLDIRFTKPLPSGREYKP